MNKPALLFNLILTNGEEKSFSLYHNDFAFDYGFGAPLSELLDPNVLQASLRITGTENLSIINNFIFENYKELVNSDNIAEINFEIYREEHPECNQKFSFAKGTFDKLNIYYTNNEHGENMFMLSFNLFGSAKNFEGILTNG